MAAKARLVSVIIPASNEAALIGDCIMAVIGSMALPCDGEVIVVANGCRDGTAGVARDMDQAARDLGWALSVLDLPEGNKLAALNAGDAAAQGEIRVYLDADVTVSAGLLPALVTALDRDAPAYASGRVRITARGAVSRAYARLWARVPFMARGVPGCGLFAVNAAGRARWGAFPAIISDDTYVRLHFTPDERHPAPAPYDWPIAEGFAALTRVRRRQDRGVQEIAERFPHLLANDDKLPMGPARALWLALSDPLGIAIYAAVALRVKLTRGDLQWVRGR